MSGVILLVIRLLAAGVLYFFLGWIIWQLWLEIRRESRALEKPLLPVLSLIATTSQGESSHKFNHKEILIGRDAVCDLRLEDQTISARHARLSFRQGQWWIEDLHSKNGTLLNLAAISAPVVLTSNDKIQCGQVEILVHIEADEFAGEKR